MPKTIEHVHWPDAPDLWMPYAPAIKVKGGTTVYLAGVTAPPVYHHHPHRPEEFDSMPRDMEGQARARNVLIEFPSVQHALDCFHSDEYQAVTEFAAPASNSRAGACPRNALGLAVAA